jgi:hypothetical protein
MAADKSLKDELMAADKSLKDEFLAAIKSLKDEQMAANKSLKDELLAANKSLKDELLAAYKSLKDELLAALSASSSGSARAFLSISVGLQQLDNCDKLTAFAAATSADLAALLRANGLGQYADALGHLTGVMALTQTEEQLRALGGVGQQRGELGREVRQPQRRHVIIVQRRRHGARERVVVEQNARQRAQ